jgi:hypothetical protein
LFVPLNVEIPKTFATWIPYPTIPSCNDELKVELRMIIPKSFPSGFQIPVIAWIVDENLHASG